MQGGQLQTGQLIVPEQGADVRHGINSPRISQSSVAFTMAASKLLLKVMP